ncbi:MAG: polysaccharide biosynthesis protein [Clostridium sp.]|nr:polysaccharide biosynthesis protein [Clostridium sp.]
MKEQSATKGFAILSIATLFIKVLSAFYNPFLVKIIGGDGPFGIYTITYQIYVFVYVITNTGIPSAISKLVSEFIAVENYRSAIKTFKISRFILIIIGVATSLMMFFGAGLITRVMGMPEARTSVMALSPALLFTSVGAAYRGYFQGRGNMKPTAISQVIEQIMNTIFSLLFAYILIKHSVILGVVGATIGTTLGAFSSAVFLFVVYIKEKHMKYVARNGIRHTNKQILKKIANYSIPITISIGVINAGTLVDTTNTVSRLAVAGFMHPAIRILVGRYQIFNTLINVPIAIITALAVSILPSVSRSAAVKDKEMLKKKINFAMRVCFLIAIPSAAGLSVLSTPIFRLLYPENLKGAGLLLVGTIVLIFMCVVQIQTSILQGIGKIYTVTFYAIVGIILKITINYCLIAQPKINIYGAIIGSVIGFLIPMIMNLICMEKYLRFKIGFSKYAFKPIVSSIFMASVIYFVYNLTSFIMGIFTKGYLNNALSLIISFVAGVIAYFYSICLIKGITADEINILPRSLRKFIPKRLFSRL